MKEPRLSFRLIALISAAALLLPLAACALPFAPAGQTLTQETAAAEPSPTDSGAAVRTDTAAQHASAAQRGETEETATDAGESADADAPETGTPESPAEEEEEPSYTVVIDPGHQTAADTAPEAVGPGSSETKYRVTGGTRGTATGIAEYELNLQVSLMLRDALTALGWTVIMTRETNDVDLSNQERTALANAAGADAYLRIHANGSSDSSAHGVLTICMTPQNPYNSELYSASRALSECIGSAVAAQTGAADQGVWETDTMTGINWSQVPVTILEMGYMTNPDEDRALASQEYRQQIVDGIVLGLQEYFARRSAEDAELAQRRDAMPELYDAIDAALAPLSSTWDVWAEDLTHGGAVHCTHNLADGAVSVSASLIKLFIMGAVFQAVDAGTLAEADVSESLRCMITVSDNASANRLVLLLGGGDAAAGMEAVNAFAAQTGCGDVRMNRLMLDENGLQNYVSAASCAELLRAVYRGTCVSAEASADMLALLCAQTVNDRIPAGLPDGTVCAHKTGNLYALCVADVGIVFSPGADYIFCAVCNSPYTDAGATAEIVTLSALVYDYFNP